MSQTIPSFSLDELEALIRRVVREELIRLLHTPARSIVDDWKQEGANDDGGDELLLQEALAVLQQYRDQPDAWQAWQDFEAELDQAERSDELPD